MLSSWPDLHATLMNIFPAGLLPFLGLAHKQNGVDNQTPDWTRFALHMLVIILMAMMGYGISRIDAVDSKVTAYCISQASDHAALIAIQEKIKEHIMTTTGKSH
jgi:hypothetical protein